MFEPLFVCSTFEAKCIPLKLCCRGHINVGTCTLVQFKGAVNNVVVFQKR